MVFYKKNSCVDDTDDAYLYANRFIYLLIKMLYY